jgi:hypothetical protein
MNSYAIVQFLTTKMTLFAKGNIMLFNFMSKFLMQYSIDS